jgi:hypothetical protein
MMAGPPDPEAVERVADFYARFYHETPDDAEAAEDVRLTLRDRPQERARLVEAFEEFLAADLPPGAQKEFVRRHANRLSANDEHARTFIVDSYRDFAE